MEREKQNRKAQRIRSDYEPRERTELDSLIELDKKVKAPTKCFGCFFGILSVLIMGAGMSLVMTDIRKAIGIPHPMTVGIAIGSVGIVLASVNYPIVKAILKARRKKYAENIIALSDKVIED